MLVKDLMTGDPVVIDADVSTISDAMAKMRSTDIHQLPVMNGKKYSGMLNYREILRKRSIRMNARVDTFTINTPKLAPDSDIKELVRLIHETGLSAFPVLSKGKLVGIVSRSDVIAHLSELPETAGMRVRQIMSTPPVYVQEGDSVDIAAERMRGLDEVELPVADSKGKLAGILRLDEIASDTFRREKQGVRGGYMYFGNVGGGTISVMGDAHGEKEKAVISVSSLMDNPSWVHGDDTIAEAAELLNSRHLHVVPVVNGDMEIEGAVSVSDIIGILDSGEEKEGILIQVTGLDPYDQDLYDITYAMTSKFAGRFSRISGIRHGKINLHILKYHSEGRTKYSVRTKIIAEPLTMSLDHHDWNFGKCLSFIFETYEQRLRKWKEK